MTPLITVIGAGLAGAEAAYQIARRGLAVRLFEMRPAKPTPAHKTANFAELVCSNSLKSARPDSATGLLQAELRRLDSLLLRTADEAALPGGQALVVDRDVFGALVTEKLLANPLIEVVREEVTCLPKGPELRLVASGPLTSDALSQAISQLAGQDHLYFYDAVAPIVTRDSVDETQTFWASRYGLGSADSYLNCPLTREEYEAFYQTLMNSEQANLHDFDRKAFFEGCLPIEEIARRGPNVLAFGPMKPTGLVDPTTGRRPYAVIQLRPENADGSLLNLVGFQTALKWGEQDRLVRLIPALRNAEIVRYGVMHRNTYLHSPGRLRASLNWLEDETLFFAGQIVGVEGYLESIATGLLAGLNVARLAQGLSVTVPPPETMLGALVHYVEHGMERSKGFPPMNANLGILPMPEGVRQRKVQLREAKVERAQKALAEWATRLEEESVLAR